MDLSIPAIAAAINPRTSPPAAPIPIPLPIRRPPSPNIKQMPATTKISVQIGIKKSEASFVKPPIFLKSWTYLLQIRRLEVAKVVL